MGKSEKGAVFLDPALYSPYDFYQYWRNVNDEDVVRFLKLFTFLPLEEIAQYEKDGVNINEAKERLAWEQTKIIHGQEEADKARAPPERSSAPMRASPPWSRRACPPSPSREVNLRRASGYWTSSAAPTWPRPAAKRAAWSVEAVPG